VDHVDCSHRPRHHYRIVRAAHRRPIRARRRIPAWPLSLDQRTGPLLDHSADRTAAQGGPAHQHRRRRQQETITNDNVPIKVNAVVWYRIVNPMASVLEVKNIDTAVIQVALTTLRTGIGQHSLDQVLKEQEAVAKRIEEKIDAVTEPWGVKVERVEMKNVEIPQSMQRVMAQEAEALREKRARIIKAQAEFEAAEQLRKASEIIMQNPAALELRRMQMITEVGAEQNTMTIIMMPSEFVAMAKSIGNLGKPSAQ
jgi:regulator of protease activity HflC (stomatin/prohibitin superfamily)